MPVPALLAPIAYMVGGALLTAAATIGFKERCACCNGVFTLNEACSRCGRWVCGSCGTDFLETKHRGWLLAAAGRACPTCSAAYRERIQILPEAVDLAENVGITPKSYKGKDKPKAKMCLAIQTEWHRDKEDAERELRIIAALEGCEHVLQVHYRRKVEEEGNFKYSVFQGVGVI